MGETSFSTCLYLFKEVFNKKLSTDEYFFVYSQQNIEIWATNNYLTRIF